MEEEKQQKRGLKEGYLAWGAFLSTKVFSIYFFGVALIAIAIWSFWVGQDANDVKSNIVLYLALFGVTLLEMPPKIYELREKGYTKKSFLEWGGMFLNLWVSVMFGMVFVGVFYTYPEFVDKLGMLLLLCSGVFSLMFQLYLSKELHIWGKTQNEE